LLDLFSEGESVVRLKELVDRAKTQEDILWAGEKHAQKILRHYISTLKVVEHDMLFPGTMRKNQFGKLYSPRIGMSGGEVNLDYIWLGHDVFKKMTVFIALQ
jgi:hypothetical protein